jgi:hypothetical protein
LTGTLADLLAATLLIGFGAARLGILGAVETGPGMLAEYAREWFLVRYGGDSWQYEGVTCPMCQSFWWAGMLAGILSISGLVYAPGLLFWLLWAGGAGIAYGFITWVSSYDSDE